MSIYLVPSLVGLALLAAVLWVIAGYRRRAQAREQALEELGFRPCPDRKLWLEETVSALENLGGFRYDVTSPKQLGSRSPSTTISKRARPRDTPTRSR